MTEVRPKAIVVMGVSGSGKSTALLAMMLRFEFQGSSTRQKMSGKCGAARH
jgi:ABC-type lipoprotein export system ATPase subunit